MPRARTSFRPCLESLEDRLVLTIALISGGVIEVDGTPNKDKVTVGLVKKNGVDNFRVTQWVNGKLTSQADFTSQQVNGRRIIFHGGSGDDTFEYGIPTNNLLMALTVQVDAGPGKDTIYGGPLADQIDGGSGEDRLWGHGGNDHLWGGNDNDKLFGDEGNDILEGGSGLDTLHGGDNNDLLYGCTVAFLDDNAADIIYGDQGQDQFKLDLPGKKDRFIDLVAGDKLF